MLLDREYDSGTWDDVRSDAELPPFGVVAGYCMRFGEGARILELGCGEGLLAERIGMERLAGFVGVDLSSSAITRDHRRGAPPATLVCADIRAYLPEGRFDVIVFNQVLEYVERPAQVVGRYEAWLAAGGVIVVSPYLAPDGVRTRRIWRQLHRCLGIELEARVQTAQRLTWVIEVLRPPPT